MIRLILLTFCILAISACESEPPKPAIFVYASGGDGSELEQIFDDFTAATNIPVTPVWGDSTSNTDQLIGNANDPVDVLITSNVADIWRAADEGVLRPISSALFDSADPLLKDADGFWVAIDMRFHAIAMRKEKVRPLVASYEQLASPELRGRVCLSSSKLHVNRSLIAMLIDDRGVKKAERLVRSWILNLATSPFKSQEELIEAIRDGACDYGITSWMPEFDEVAYFLPEGGYLDIDAVGVTRHARQSNSAQNFVEWLLKNKSLRVKSEFDRRPVGIAGWHDEEARLLAERAVYR